MTFMGKPIEKGCSEALVTEDMCRKGEHCADAKCEGAGAFSAHDHNLAEGE